MRNYSVAELGGLNFEGIVVPRCAFGSMSREILFIKFIPRSCREEPLGRLTSFDDQVHADGGAPHVGRVALGLTVVGAGVRHPNVGDLQAAVVVAGSSRQLPSWATSPADTGTMGSLVTALEHDLTTCGWGIQGAY